MKLFGKGKVKDLRKFFEYCNEKKLNRYIKREVDTSEQKEVDYSRYNGWWHALSGFEKIGQFVWYVHGFDSATGLLNNRKIRTGDLIYHNLENGKIGKYLVLNLESCNDPSDMFFAYIVQVGYKEED